MYAPVRNHEFVNIDDPQYVFENAAVREGLSARSVRWALTTGHAGNWHPLTWISHMIDVEVFGLDAGAHHLVNVAFHAANTLLLFFVLFRRTGAAGPAALVAGLFGLHPLRVESVAWIAERKDVLSTFFWLLAMMAYARYVERPSLARYGAVAASFACGLMSKPSVVTLPLALLLLDFWPLGRTGLWRCVREKLPLLALSAAAGAITLIVQSTAGAVQSLEAVPAAMRAANMGLAYARYLALMVWPLSLAPLYPYDLSPPAWSVVSAWLLVLALSALALRARRRAPYVAFGWAWYVVTLLPMIGIIQVGSQPIADRYTYVPLIGIFVAMAWGARDLAARVALSGRAPAVAAAVVLLALAALAWRQVHYWHDSVTLWTRAVEVHGNYRARAHLGQALGLRGRWHEALPVLEDAVRLNPDFADSQHHLGFTYDELGDRDRAIDRYRAAVRLRPGYPEAHGNLGIALAEGGEVEAGVRHLREAVRLDPGSRVGASNLATALTHLGVTQAARGDRAAALESFREALRLQPGNSDLQQRIRLLEADK